MIYEQTDPARRPKAPDPHDFARGKDGNCAVCGFAQYAYWHDSVWTT